MVAWARLMFECHRGGIHRNVKLIDALIAATATAHGLPVVTQDEDYSLVADAHSGLRVMTV